MSRRATAVKMQRASASAFAAASEVKAPQAVQVRSQW
jgi:hypothetical protein